MECSLTMLVSRLLNSCTIADGACEARSRSDAEAMLFHRRRIATTRSPATPIGPTGCGGTAPSSLSLLGHNEEHCSLVAARTRGRCARNKWCSYLGDGTLESRVMFEVRFQ